MNPPSRALKTPSRDVLPDGTRSVGHGLFESTSVAYYNVLYKKETRYFLKSTSLWWELVDSNHRSITQQIYSLSPLATRESSPIRL